MELLSEPQQRSIKGWSLVTITEDQTLQGVWNRVIIEGSVPPSHILLALLTESCRKCKNQIKRACIRNQWSRRQGIKPLYASAGLWFMNISRNHASDRRWAQPGIQGGWNLLRPELLSGGLGLPCVQPPASHTEWVASLFCPLMSYRELPELTGTWREKEKPCTLETQ